MDSHQLAHTIARLMHEKQAGDVLILNLSEVSSFADYFVLSTGSVDVHLKAIVEHVKNSLASLPHPITVDHIEGDSYYYWVLLDYGDVVGHVFSPDARQFYQLEKLWGDVPTEELDSIAPVPT